MTRIGEVITYLFIAFMMVMIWLMGLWADIYRVVFGLGITLLAIAVFLMVTLLISHVKSFTKKK